MEAIVAEQKDQPEVSTNQGSDLPELDVPVLSDAEYFTNHSTFFERLQSEVKQADALWKPERVTKVIKALIRDDNPTGDAENSEDKTKVRADKTEEKTVSLAPTPPSFCLIHYTTEQGFDAIVDELKIAPSDKGREGPGVYFTTLDSHKVGKTAVLINNYDRVMGPNVAHLKYGIAVYGILSDCEPRFMKKHYRNMPSEKANHEDLLGYVRERESVVHRGPVYLKGCKLPEAATKYHWHYFRI